MRLWPLLVGLGASGCASLYVVDARRPGEPPRATAILVGQPGEVLPRAMAERLEAGCAEALRRGGVERAPKPPFLRPGPGESYYPALARASSADSFLVLRFSFTPAPPSHVSTVLATLVAARGGQILRSAVLQTDDGSDERSLGQEVCRAVVSRPR